MQRHCAVACWKRGVKIVSGGTDNHLMLVDLTGTDVSGKELERRLDQAHITCNKNTIPNDPRSPFVTSGVRLGTPGNYKQRNERAGNGSDCGNDRDGDSGYRQYRESKRDGTKADQGLSFVRISGMIKRICFLFGKQILFIILFCCITFKY